MLGHVNLWCLWLSLSFSDPILIWVWTHNNISIIPQARLQRTPSSTSEDSLKLQSSSSIERELWEGELSSSPRKNSLSRIDSKQKGRSLFSLGSKTQSLEGQNQMPTRLLQLATSKDKKDKKKKKSKSQPQDAGEHSKLSCTNSIEIMKNNEFS